VFAGDAKRFYDAHVYGDVGSVQDAFLRMSEEYNTPTRQLAVKHQLSELRLSHFVTQGQTEKQALESVRSTITRLAPQLPPTYRADNHKVDFLRHAVVGMPWTQGPVSRIAVDNPTYHSFFLQLDAALDLQEEGRAAVSKDAPVYHQAPVAAAKGGAPIMYAGQGVYGVPKRGVGASTSRSTAGVGSAAAVSLESAGSSAGAQRTRFDPLSLAGCFNCDNPSHTMRACPLPVDPMKAAQRKLEYFSKKNAGAHGAAAAVLCQLCQQSYVPRTDVDNDHNATPPKGEWASGDAADDAAVFQTLLLESTGVVDHAAKEGNAMATEEVAGSTASVSGSAAGFSVGE